MEGRERGEVEGGRGREDGRMEGRERGWKEGGREDERRILKEDTSRGKEEVR